MDVYFMGEVALNVTVLSPSLLWLLSPPLNLTDSYVNVSFVSPDGGYGEQPDGVCISLSSLFLSH